MNRRAYLAAGATVAASAPAGCLARLGLVERLTVVEKSVIGIDDGRARPLATRVAEGSDATYDGEIDDRLAAHVDPDGPLVLGSEAVEALESAFDAVEYVVRGCEGDRTDCLEVTLFPDDFDAFAVGDVIDVRVSDGSAGLVDVRER